MGDSNRTRDVMKEEEIHCLRNQQLNLLHQLAEMNTINNLTSQIGVIPSLQPQAACSYYPYYGGQPIYYSNVPNCCCEGPFDDSNNIIDVEGRIIDD